MLGTSFVLFLSVMQLFIYYDVFWTSLSAIFYGRKIIFYIYLLYLALDKQSEYVTDEWMSTDVCRIFLLFGRAAVQIRLFKEN